MANFIDEGYIKYQINWTETSETVEKQWIQAMNECRSRLFQAALIGYSEILQVGYGNISIRHPENPQQFIISGTQTGHLPHLSPEHYSWVKSYDIEANSLDCEGPVKASSESLTHAAIYELNPQYQAVIHIHSQKLWTKYMHQLPTTDVEVPYGTPEMAGEIKRLYEEENAAEHRFVLMAGHEDGIITFGETMEEAEEAVLIRNHELEIMNLPLCPSGISPEEENKYYSETQNPLQRI